MIFSRHHIDKLGEQLIGDPFLRTTALEEIGKWRATHLPVLKDVYEQVTEYFAMHGISHVVSSMRVKRMTSIEGKLRNNKEKKMKLGGMQDIGGVRFVFADIDTLDRVVEVLEDFVPEGFERVDKDDKFDYVKHPKCSGYRSVHHVYRRISDNKEQNGLSIELQVRTQLQHYWAMAVETASLITHSSLKADIDDQKEWRGFFKLISAIFAKEEHKPVNEAFAEYDKQDYCKSYFEYTEKKLMDKFSALRVSVNHNYEDVKNGTCVLVINFNDQVVYINTFEEGREQEASDMFNKIEGSIDRRYEAALMVSIEKMQELQEAYPSYFLDTQQFKIKLQQFETSCKVS